MSRIDSIGSINIEELSYGDIKCGYGTGLSVHVSGTGRDKVSKYRHGVMTAIGDVEISLWTDIAKRVIGHKGDGAEFLKKFVWVKRQKRYNLYRTEAEFLQHALDLFVWEKADPKTWAAILNRKRFSSVNDFESSPGFKQLKWLNSRAETMEDGSEWSAVITELGEIQMDLWIQLCTD